MLIKIGDFEFTEVWDGVLYKKLSRYPEISAWEMLTLIEFTEYEKRYGRACPIECEDERLRQRVLEGLKNKEEYIHAERPSLITECTACPHRKGCETAFVCHTASAENAEKILDSGKLLSAVRARGIPAEKLMKESRNAAHDPADYFDYIMFTWGNCQGGDRLMTERKLGRFPDEQDLSTFFQPGVRFYFGYDELKNHPGRVFDGVLPMKVKDEIILSDWLFRIIIPSREKSRLERHIPDALKDRVIYADHNGEDVWEWSEKVYRIIETEGALNAGSGSR